MWYTQIKIKAERSAVDTLAREFEKALGKERIAGRGNYWLGNLALHIGCREEDVQADARKYSGRISLMRRESPTVCVISTWSEECPSTPCVKDFVNAFVEDAWITYTAQEEAEQDTLMPRCWTNDPDTAGTVYIDWFEELPEDLEDLLLKLQETSQEHVEKKLSGFLGQEGTLEELRQALEDRYDKAIVFNTYEYVCISQTIKA